MNPEEVKALVEAGFDGADVAVKVAVTVSQIRVVSDAFEGLMPVKKQQLVYATINAQIQSNTIHGRSPLPSPRRKSFQKMCWPESAHVPLGPFHRPETVHG